MTRLSTRQKELLRKSYIARINRVIDYIDKNLAKVLSLDELAEVADFSPFHFHRIFKAFVGETLFGFIKRLRLEKAASMISYDTGLSITAVALSCGFATSQAFSRDFKTYFGMPPSRFRASCEAEKSKNWYKKSKQRKDLSGLSGYYLDINSLKPERGWKKDMKVRVEDVSEMTIAYVRHVGPYIADTKLFAKLFGRVMKWAQPRELIKFPETKFLTIYHDDPKITKEEKLRISVGITVPKDTKVSGEIGLKTIPAGKYAIAHFEIHPDEYEEAWRKLLCDWMPESGYVPDDRHCFEVYLNDPKQHPEGKHIVDIYEPVKPA